MNYILLGLTIVCNVFVAIFADTDFLISTDYCKIPNFPAFSEETNLTYIPQNYTKCSDFDLLTYTTVENNTAYLHIKKENEVHYSSGSELYCCYRYVTRKGSIDEPDVGISLTDCRHFSNSVQLEGDIVMVECYNKTTLVYENVHNPIIISNLSKKKISQRAPPSYVTPISVLIVVIDSISRLNLERTMPNTKNVLLANGFTEFVGYNKIDDNTFPNFAALLSGLNLKQSLSICAPTKIGKLDECPMIWYDFRNKGYITAYAEDWASISTFNYFKKGFKDPPTDYYFKPFIEASETLYVTVKDTMPYCAGPETQGERILNLAKDFSNTFRHHPSFGVFWMNTFSHNYINSPSGMDEKVKNFFQDLKQNGILDKSVVILLSDHGIRFGQIRETIQGWYEERLPANYISLPRWFKRRYPTKHANFKKNANKLTSTYDLYMTLQDILNMSVDKFHYNISSSMACTKCSSLFSEIPENRTCEDAGIPVEWCTCIGKFEKKL
ncbi:hypothetical protein NQ314_011409 [Rhamnusium bicolor]|uniref:DUF229 domain containing protein n=1 Tax=Rhamnusium bicolor TaxID=1586634 RepID=A0AAV8XJD5_9CUCU|nr:hypothetical protein NQ314_011409 [Rhamnusium bicolor]